MYRDGSGQDMHGWTTGELVQLVHGLEDVQPPCGLPGTAQVAVPLLAQTCRDQHQCYWDCHNLPWVLPQLIPGPPLALALAPRTSEEHGRFVLTVTLHTRLQEQNLPFHGSTFPLPPLLSVPCY